MENQHQEQPAIDNLDKLKEEVKMTGFNNYFDRDIEARIKAGKTDFQLSRSMQVEEERIDYTLHFHVDKENRKGYLNDMDAALKVPELGEEKRHTFPRYLQVTAKEAYNLLKYGEATAVQKKLFNKKGEKYLSYITLDLKGKKDAKNNYPLKQYHEKYYKKKPFSPEKAIDELPVQVKELENQVTREFTLKSLKRGNRQQVTIFHKGVVEPGYLMLNAIAGKIDTYDSSMQPIQGKTEEQKTEKAQEQPSESQPEEIKKKSGNDQKVRWTSKKASGIKP